MEPRKLKIGFARFPYAGNGGARSEHPAVGDWVGDTRIKIARDERCEPKIFKFERADTPITMTRNAALRVSQKAGVDVLVMIDSDQIPDLYAGIGAKPFWDSSFDFLYEHWGRGPCIVAAPYCGPPPDPIRGGIESVYAFRWAYDRNERDRRRATLVMYEREDAGTRVGIEEVAAAPTGLIMIDMRALERIPLPWFDYEWADYPYNTEKATTEDVYFTRNASLAGVPVFINWDSWAGHAKQEIVGKPIVPTADSFREEWTQMKARARDLDGPIMEVNPGKSAGEIIADLGLMFPQVEVRPLPTRSDSGDQRPKGESLLTDAEAIQLSRENEEVGRRIREKAELRRMGMDLELGGM